MGQAAVKNVGESQEAPEPPPQVRHRHAELPDEGLAGERTYLSRT